MEAVSSVESGGFSVRDIEAIREENTDSDLFWGSDGVSQETPIAVDDNQVNELLLDTICVMVSKLAVALTGFEEVGLDASEQAQLVKLWAPFKPGLSPIANAIMGTALILSSKAFLYLHLRKKSSVVREGDV